MIPERYVVLGLARPRAPWFSEISRWATTAALPVEFVKCLTAEEARARLASDRQWSAFLVDGNAHGLDRDLLDTALSAKAAPFVLSATGANRNWTELGAVAVLSPTLSRDELLLALAEHARPVVHSSPRPPDTERPAPPPWRGTLVAVCGTGGSGTSTIAAMMAHGLGRDVRDQGLVLLADLALHADQAVIHDAGDVVPGLPELVDSHRLGQPSVDEVRALAYHGGRERPYDLLLGLRRHRDWTALRPRAVEASVDGLRAAYRMIIADVEGDVEGEEETGSPDIEDRNLLARGAIREADVVVAVGRPGVVGTHRLARLVRDLRHFGVPAERLLPLINRAPRSPRARAEMAATVARLSGPEAVAVASATFVGERRRLDEVIRASSTWPQSLCDQLAETVRGVLSRPGDSSQPSGPVRVVPGSLGSFTDAESEVS